MKKTEKKASRYWPILPLCQISESFGQGTAEMNHFEDLTGERRKKERRNITNTIYFTILCMAEI